MVGKQLYRAVFAVLIASSIVFLLANNVFFPPQFPTGIQEGSQVPIEGDAADRNITVVTSDLRGFMVAFRSDGSMVYSNESHDLYYDVDPSPVGDMTVLYAAVDNLPLNSSYCRPQGQAGETCTRQYVERANLTTGEVTRLYSRVYPKRGAAEWHDVDRVDDSHVAVTDMYADEAFIVNVETGIVTWEWNVQDYLPITTGGSYPGDWVHLNDVEALDDGRVMVSLRNQDQVVFVNRSTGAVRDWTLGSDGDHTTIYAQHNPDYIPAESGGPAIVVADSHNNRAVEYQRTDSGGWEQTWVWQDDRLAWPRDADRLPNGHTLITDTNANRILEVNERGDIVWSASVFKPYEAERLGTGSESADGPSALTADLRSRTHEDDSSSAQGGIRVKRIIRGLFPTKVVNAISFFLGDVGLWWVGLFDLIALLTVGGTTVVWGGAEFYWAGYRLHSPVTRVD